MTASTTSNTSDTPNTPTIYFAYGSNIWLHQLRTRCPHSTYLGVARLPSYHFFIAALGGANIRPGSPTDEVWGLAYALQPSDEETLDKLERVASGHFGKEILEVELWEGKEGERVDVAGKARQVKVLVYVSRERVQTGSPRVEYVGRMNRAIEDALGCGVPGEYVEGVLRNWIPREDGVVDNET